jgi:hypothetical protein
VDGALIASRWNDEYRNRRYADEAPLPFVDQPWATAKQRTAARRNIKKAAAAARRKRTLSHRPKRYGADS